MRFKHLPNTLRLAGFLAVGFAVTSVVAVRQARAQVHEGMRRLARQLMPYAEQGVIEAPRRVVINGESLYLAMGTTHDSVPAVLDYYQRWCSQRSGHINDAVAGNASNPAGQLWSQGAAMGGGLEALRLGDDQEGYVACVDVGEGRVNTNELVRRVQAVVDTGDLSRWGNLRYAYVTRGRHGTRILTVASEGRFNLLRMFPAEGDAPGQDIPGLARFQGMRRVLSAYEDGQPNGLGMYTVRAPMSDVRGWYRNEMGRHGWTLTEIPHDRPLPEAIEASRARSLAFSRGNDATMVLVFDQADGVTSMMSLMAM